jgi:hypothetical protein
MRILPDPLEDFLQHPPSLPADAVLRESLAERTASMLPKPRRRRWPTAAAIAASIVLATVSAYFGFRAEKIKPLPPKDIVHHKDEPRPEEKPKPPPEETKPPVVSKPVDPRDLEWTAFDAPDDPERVRLYFQAGDLYLDKHQDYESAVRCYSQAIHYSEPQDLEFNPDENWLVMALKRDHRKEK